MVGALDDQKKDTSGKKHGFPAGSMILGILTAGLVCFAAFALLCHGLLALLPSERSAQRTPVLKPFGPVSGFMVGVAEPLSPTHTE